MRIIVIVVLSLMAAIFFRDYCLERIYVATPSMESTLAVNSRWWVDKFSLRWRRPGRGEIVVLPSPITTEKDLIKRIIAIGGDKVEIREKIVYLNGQETKEPYVMHTRSGEMLEGDNLGPLQVPANHVFLLGDNRDESGDSRDWKNTTTGERIYFVSNNDLKGRLLGVP